MLSKWKQMMQPIKLVFSWMIEGTIPFRSDYMKDIRLVKASSGTATWANVPDGKYYVFELDENGDPMTINDSIIIDEGKSYYYDVTDSNEKCDQ